jgi:hypothetical protein
MILGVIIALAALCGWMGTKSGPDYVYRAVEWLGCGSDWLFRRQTEEGS